MEATTTPTTPTSGRDLHSPANVRPEDYSYFGCWEPLPAMNGDDAMMLSLMGPKAAEAFRAHRDAMIAQRKALHAEIAAAGYAGNFAHKGTCDHCGAYFKYGSIFRHEPTGHLIVVGWICAEETFDCPTKAALDQKKARERAAGGREALRVAGLVTTWIEEDPTRQDLIDFMIARPDDSFYQDLLAKMRKYGPLSERQEAAVRKGPAMEAARAARAAQDAEAGPVPEGRMVIEGEVVSTKWQDSDFGGSLKMLVRLGNGSKVWGSVPSSLQAMEQEITRGDTVRFTATVTKSDRDESFGYYKRPVKAERIGTAADGPIYSGIQVH